MFKAIIISFTCTMYRECRVNASSTQLINFRHTVNTGYISADRMMDILHTWL